jgi:phenylacetate-CoA ligase
MRPPLAKVVRRSLTRNFFEPLFWRLKKMPVLARYKQFRELQWDTCGTFQQRQDDALRSLLAHAVRRIPFYVSSVDTRCKALISNAPREALGSFPVLTKENLRSSLSELYVELGHGTFSNSSGGTTGQPVKLYQDRVYQIDALASTLLAYEWAGKMPGDSHALLWGAERDLIKGGLGIRQRTADFLGNRITLNAFRLSPERMRQYMDKINWFRPACIEGYASSLYEFAQFVERSHLAVSFPNAVVSSAGTLYPAMREIIQRVFSCPVFDRYGSREAGNMAAECERRQGLHVLGETTLIEIVDDAGNPVGEGQEGEILVTNLTNYTMPLIRYRIGDRAVSGGAKCACGRPYPLLERIAGRAGASLVTASGGVVSPEFFIHLIGVMHNDGSIGRFQVVQSELSHIVVRLVPALGADLDKWTRRDAVRRQIGIAMGGPVAVEFKIESDIEPTTTGKHLYTVSHVSHPPPIVARI